MKIKKKHKNFSAFSLIEVIVATSILSITFFGVYKLIGENMKLIHYKENYTTTTSLLEEAKLMVITTGNSVTGDITKENIQYTLTRTVTEKNCYNKIIISVDSEITGEIQETYIERKNCP